MMKHIILLILFIVPCGFIFPSGIIAQIQFNSIDYYTQDVYNTNTGTEIPLDIVIGHTGLGTNFFITISSGGSGNIDNRLLSDGSHTTEYYLYTDVQNQILFKDLTANPTNNEVLSGSFSYSESQKTVSYTYVIPSGDYPATGFYSDSVVVTLYSGTLTNYTEVSQATIQFALQVPYAIDVSVVNTNESFNENSTAVNLDFGILSSGLERSADVIVRSNVSYSVALRTQNGSVLKGTGSNFDTEIPYLCYVNGSIVNLIQYTAVEIGQGDYTSADGDRYALSFVIEDFWDVTDGPVEDIIEVSLQSK